MIKLVITLWRLGTWPQRLNMIGLALACTAATLLSLVPQWVFIALLLPAVVMQLVGVLIVRRQWEALDDKNEDT